MASEVVVVAGQWLCLSGPVATVHCGRRSSVTGKDSSRYGDWDVSERQARAGISSPLQGMPSVIELSPTQSAVLEVLPPPDRT